MERGPLEATPVGAASFFRDIPGDMHISDGLSTFVPSPLLEPQRLPPSPPEHTVDWIHHAAGMAVQDPQHRGIQQMHKRSDKVEEKQGSVTLNCRVHYTSSAVFMLKGK